MSNLGVIVDAGSLDTFTSRALGVHVQFGSCASLSKRFYSGRLDDGDSEVMDSLLYGLPALDVPRSSAISTARPVFNPRQSDHVTDTVVCLHVAERINFKMTRCFDDFSQYRI